MVKSNELERDVAGLIQRDFQKKIIKDRSAKIEHYSIMLRDDKISIKRFLKIMANVDNKIVFDESEFPTLDVDEIEFTNDADKDLYTDIVKKLNGYATAKANDNTTSTLETPTARPESVIATLPHPPLMTRSKTRKAMKQKEPIQPPSLKNRKRKHQAHETNQNEGNNLQPTTSGKRTKVINEFRFF